MSDERNHLRLQHQPDMKWVRYCPRCGGTLEDRYIEIEQHCRKICTACGYIYYLNPKVVAGAVPRQDERIWLVKRNIEPSSGSWTFPGGYVDLGERVPDAAIRETFEETGLNVRLDGLLNVYSYANVGIVLVAYRATVTGGIPELSHESKEIRDFLLDEIPWEDLAFRSTREALADYVKYEASPQKQQ
jgi:8-oxo-dGTP diphosphatase